MAHRFLTFKNGLGSAQYDNVAYSFNTCPRLPGMQFVEIEFFPRVKFRVLAQDDPDRWRDMTPVECEIAESALMRMHDQAASVFA